LPTGALQVSPPAACLLFRVLGRRGGRGGGRPSKPNNSSSQSCPDDHNL